MKSATEKAIILRKTKFGEADIILSCLLSSGQVQSYIAKSALKSKKRFGGGVLEPMNYVNLTFQAKDHYKESESLPMAIEAQIIYDFPKLRTDYEKLNLGLYAVKLISAVVREGDLTVKGLFDLVGNFLKALEPCEDLGLLKTHFEVKFLALQGVMPSTEAIDLMLKTKLQDHAALNLSDLQWSQMRRQISVTLEGYVGI